MDMEAGKTLTNEEVVRELLELLKKNAMKEQANDVFEICSYVDGLEKKIDSMKMCIRDRYLIQSTTNIISVFMIISWQKHSIR